MCYKHQKEKKKVLFLHNQVGNTNRQSPPFCNSFILECQSIISFNKVPPKSLTQINFMLCYAILIVIAFQWIKEAPDLLRVELYNRRPSLKVIHPQLCQSPSIKLQLTILYRAVFQFTQQSCFHMCLSPNYALTSPLISSRAQKVSHHLSLIFHKGKKMCHSLQPGNLFACLSFFKVSIFCFFFLQDFQQQIKARNNLYFKKNFILPQIIVYSLNQMFVLGTITLILIILCKIPNIPIF